MKAVHDIHKNRGSVDARRGRDKWRDSKVFEQPPRHQRIITILTLTMMVLLGLINPPIFGISKLRIRPRYLFQLFSFPPTPKVDLGKHWFTNVLALLVASTLPVI